MTCGVLENLAGMRFGRLKVLSISDRRKTPNGTQRVYWLCVCDCGETKEVQSAALRSGNTQSCGCFASELSSARSKTHGMCDSPEYQSWRGMVERCLNPNSTHYKDYGGRGIKIHQSMRSFDDFFSTMGLRPDDYSLERKDLNGDYCPTNCVWLPQEDQQSNTSRSWRIEIAGKTRTLKQSCEFLGIDYKRVCGRLRIGWEMWRALDLACSSDITNMFKLSR